MSAASITTAWCRRKFHELLEEVQEEIEFDPVLHERFCTSLSRARLAAERGDREAFVKHEAEVLDRLAECRAASLADAMRSADPREPPMLIAGDIRLALDASLIGERCGLTLDPWQAELLRERPKRALLNCCRQSGKSTVTALWALWQAMFDPGLIVVV